MHDSAEDGLTLKEISLLLWGHRWWIVLATVVGGLVGLFAAKTARAIYQVDALVQIEQAGSKVGANPLGEMAGAFESTSPAETEIEIIRSRMVLERAIRASQLDVVATPVDNGLRARLLGQGRPVLAVDTFCSPQGMSVVVVVSDDSRFVFYDGSDRPVRGEVGQIVQSGPVLLRVASIDAPPGTVFQVWRKSISDAVYSFRRHLSVSEVGKFTGIVRLELEGDNPVDVVRDLNAITDAYIDQNAEMRSKEVDKTLEFLRGQLPGIKERLDESEQRLNSYRAHVGALNFDAQAQDLLKQQVETQQKLVDIQQKKLEGRLLFKESHPTLAAIDSAEAIYQASANRQERLMKALPLQQQEIVRISRDVQVYTDLYTKLLQNAQQLQVIKAGLVGSVRLIDHAEPPEAPSRPNRKAIALVGLLGGLLLGAGAVFLKGLVFPGSSNPNDLAKVAKVPVLAVIPRTRQQKKLGSNLNAEHAAVRVLAYSSPSDPAIESLRDLRTSVQYLLSDATNRTVLFTGPAFAGGKSFVSMNVAVLMAQTGSRVLLVDGDLRAGTLHSVCGMPRIPGLAEVLAGKNDWNRVISNPIAGLHLSVLPCGDHSPNPSDLLQSNRAKDFFAEVSARYDYVFIDAPSILGATDAVVLGTYASATILVVRPSYRIRSELDASIARLQLAGVGIRGLVVNRDSGKSRGSWLAKRKERKP